MLPLSNGLLRTPAVYAPFLYGDSLSTLPTRDYEIGGAGISDGTQGLQVKLWMAELVGNDIILSASGVSPTTVITGSGITEISFTFDQNMRPVIAYVQNDQAKYYWYDATISNYTTTNLPSGSSNPRVCMDDKRKFSSTLGNNDVILAYIKSNNLYYRQQRDRYNTEYLLKTTVNGRLVKIGMNTVNRLQFMIKPN